MPVWKKECGIEVLAVTKCCMPQKILKRLSCEQAENKAHV